MSDESIADRWATAVFEIARDSHAIGRIRDDLRAFASVYAVNDELHTVLENPLFPEQVRENILVVLASRLGLHATVKDTLRLLSHKQRLAVLPQISRELDRLCDEHERLVRADITSAAELSQGMKEGLRFELEKATGKNVVMTFHQI